MTERQAEIEHHSDSDSDSGHSDAKSGHTSPWEVPFLSPSPDSSTQVLRVSAPVSVPLARRPQHDLCLVCSSDSHRAPECSRAIRNVPDDPPVSNPDPLMTELKEA